MVFSPTLTNKKFATTDNILANTDDTLGNTDEKSHHSLKVLVKISSVLVLFASLVPKISSVLATFVSVLAKISSVCKFSSMVVENYVYCSSPTQIFPTKTTPLVALILFLKKLYFLCEIILCQH